MMTLNELQAEIIKFRDERAWRQFHTPKNLAIAISVEAAELLDHFKWSDEFDLKEVSMELADVVIYCLNLTDVLGVDLSDAILEKLGRNNAKYPIDEYKGKWKK